MRRRGPNPERALLDYRGLAPTYDASCRFIERIRRDAVRSLRLAPGEIVYDVACGTGSTLSALADEVGTSGRAVGIELVPEMAALARQRIETTGCKKQAVVHVGSAETFASELRADAMLFCYAHDVLQSPHAIANLLSHAKPGCRIAVVGWRWVPWWWGFPVNAFNAWRARRYLTTFSGLEEPCRFLRSHLEHFRQEATYHLGSSYRALGNLPR